MSTPSANPYQNENDQKWYWHDEGYAENGPYDTYEQAKAELTLYFGYLDRQHDSYT